MDVPVHRVRNTGACQHGIGDAGIELRLEIAGDAAAEQRGGISDEDRVNGPGAMLRRTGTSITMMIRPIPG